MNHLPNEVRCTVYEDGTINFVDMHTGEVIAHSYNELQERFANPTQDIDTGRTTMTLELRKGEA